LSRAMIDYNGLDSHSHSIFYDTFIGDNHAFFRICFLVSNRHCPKCYFGGYLYYYFGKDPGKIPTVE